MGSSAYSGGEMNHSIEWWEQFDPRDFRPVMKSAKEDVLEMAYECEALRKEVERVKRVLEWIESHNACYIGRQTGKHLYYEDGDGYNKLVKGVSLIDCLNKAMAVGADTA